MPLTYPKGPNAAITYDYKPLEGYETWNGEDVPSYFDPLFPFGHGLSYTKFEYSNLVLSDKKVTEPNMISGRVTVKNTGSRSGKETVIIYINDEFGTLSRPVRQMKFFKKVTLDPNQSEVVLFNLTRYDMSFINLKNQRIVETGKFNVYVGNSNLNGSFELTAKVTSGGSIIFKGSSYNFFIIFTFISFIFGKFFI
jgi:beta-glucosidase